MTEKTTLQNEFESVWLDMIKEVALTGTYHYGEIPVEDFSKQIAFWQTIKWFREENRFNEIIEILEDHAGYATGNEMSATIAQMELLPTPVFRRVLWFYNIDFQSLESYLRRLTTEQINAISETYKDCYVMAKMPTCMKVGLWNKVRQLIPSKSIKAHLLAFYKPEDSDLDTSNRYQTKGTIAYNFFDWGIGYNTYHDEKSDGKISSNVKTQLFSHNDDDYFIVNKEEGGIYWFLHLYARANYLWGNRDKVIDQAEINRGKTICVSIGTTILIWLFLILFSPILLATAGLKFIGVKTLAFVNKFVKEKIEVDKDFWKAVVVIVLIIVCSNFVVYLGKEMYAVLYDFSDQNHWYAASALIFIVMYSIYMTHYEEWIWPQRLPWIGKPLLGYILLQTLYDHGKAMFDFLVYLVSTSIEAVVNFSSWMMKHGDIFLPFLIIVVSYIGIVYWWYKLSDNANKYINTKEVALLEFLERVYLPLTIVSAMLFVVSIPVLFSLATYTTVRFWEFSNSSLIFMSGCGGVLALIFYSNFRHLNPKFVRVEALIRNTKGYDYRKWISKNRWIQSLTKPTEIVDKITNFADDWMYEGSQKKIFLSSIDNTGYKVLKQYDSYFRNKVVCLEDRLILIDYLLEGEKLSTALLKLKQKKQKVTKFNQWVESLKQPFIYIKKFILDMYDLRKKLTERCPFMFVSEQIK